MRRWSAAARAMRAFLLLAQLTVVLTPRSLPTPNWRTVKVTSFASNCRPSNADVPPRVVRAATAFAAAAVTAAATAARASASATENGAASTMRKRRRPPAPYERVAAASYSSMPEAERQNARPSSMKGHCNTEFCDRDVDEDNESVHSVGEDDGWASNYVNDKIDEANGDAAVEVVASAAGDDVDAPRRRGPPKLWNKAGQFPSGAIGPRQYDFATSCALSNGCVFVGTVATAFPLTDWRLKICMNIASNGS
eukprot:1913000-Pleurochrysis_carterae.AAC.1